MKKLLTTLTAVLFAAACGGEEHTAGRNHPVQQDGSVQDDSGQNNPEDTPCQSNTDCGTDTLCASGLGYCSSGEPGSPCVTGADCRPAYICSPTDKTCRYGTFEACAVEDDCRSGYFCSPRFGNCITGQQGRPCITDEDCVAGLMCGQPLQIDSAPACYPETMFHLENDGGPCTADEQCWIGLSCLDSWENHGCWEEEEDDCDISTCITPGITGMWSLEFQPDPLPNRLNIRSSVFDILVASNGTAQGSGEFGTQAPDDCNPGLPFGCSIAIEISGLFDSAANTFRLTWPNAQNEYGGGNFTCGITAGEIQGVIHTEEASGRYSVVAHFSRNSCSPVGFDVENSGTYLLRRCHCPLGGRCGPSEGSLDRYWRGSGCEEE